MEKIRLCMDCKSYLDMGGSIFELRHKCTNKKAYDSASTRCLITGKVIIDSEMLECSYQRAKPDNIHCCGPSARWFEPKGRVEK